MQMKEAIKADLRAAMNGVAAKAIRESGMGYRLAYGVELPRLREIAAAYEPERHLAQELWGEDVREMRILATMLYPVAEFDRDRASMWIDDIAENQAELANHLCMNLIAQQDYAADFAFCLIADEGRMRQLCGYLVLTRLLMHGARLSPDAEQELRDQAATATTDACLPLRRAAANALLRIDDAT